MINWSTSAVVMFVGGSDLPGELIITKKQKKYGQKLAAKQRQ